jgi:RNase P protein component
LRENYKNLEESLKKGYSIVFLVKKDKSIDELNFINIKRDLDKIFKASNILIMDKNE